MRILSFVVLGFGLIAALGPTAHAHAVPVRFEPGPGARLPESPSLVAVEFSERLDARSTQLRVLNETFGRVDQGPRRIVDGDRVEVDLLAGLPTGGYLVQWETLSRDDGHITRGSWAFAVGDAAVPETPVVETPGFPAAAAFGKALAYAGLAIALALAVFRLWIRPDAPEANSIVRLALAASAMQTLGIVMIAIQASSAADSSFTEFVRSTEFGRGLLVRLGLAVALVGICALDLGAARPANGVAQALLTPLLLVASAAQGHVSAAVKPYALGVLLDAFHVGAGLLWAGGLVVLLLAMRTSTEPSTENRATLATMMRKFSTVASACIAVLALTGIFMVAALFGASPAGWVGHLDSPYGIVLLYKVLLALAMIGFGAVNHYAYVVRFQRGVGFDRWVGFRANLRREAVNGILILILAAALTSLNPV